MKNELRTLRLSTPLCTIAIAMLVASTLLPASGHAQSNSPNAQILSKLDAISAQLDVLADASVQVGDLYVPFKVEVEGGLCDSGNLGTSNPEIIIDSDGTDTFVVTSILLKRAFMDPVDFGFLTVNTVAIDGTNFDTRTSNLFAPIGAESGVLQSADILGMPVRRSPEFDPEEGGNIPHQITAEGEGISDVHVLLFCSSDLQDMNLATILVAGWKKPADTVTVTYVAGD